MVLTIGTDCSGIEAPLQALKQLRIPYIQKWSCEIDKYARISCEANYPEPKKIYIDMLKRDNEELPHVDLYVCGFPCQAFSNMGKRLGTSDPRAEIIPKMIDTIYHSKPKICILENVKGFTNIEKGIPMKNLLNQLELFGYKVYYSLYNTKHYGLPQNRERIYFVYIRNDIRKKDYIKPKECKMKSFENILVDTKVQIGEIPDMYKKNLGILKEQTKIITPFNYFTGIEYVSPTLDTKCSSFYIIQQNRKLLPIEVLKLQGFSDKFNQVVSNNQLMKQIGNSMSVNVLKKIITEAILCI